MTVTTPQVVILGAGLDTRAWRMPGLDGVTVFEVDHPDTQRRKRHEFYRVAHARIATRAPHSAPAPQATRP